MIRRLLDWIAQETRLATADNWAREDMAVTPPAPTFRPCSSEDPRCAETMRRLAECRERMRRMKAGLLDAPERKFTDAASTDVSATIRRAQARTIGPVRAVRRASR